LRLGSAAAKEAQRRFAELVGFVSSCGTWLEKKIMVGAFLNIFSRCFDPLHPFFNCISGVISLLINAVSRLGPALRDTFRTLSRTKPETLGAQEGNGTSAKKSSI